MKRINIPDLLPNTNYALRIRVKNGDAVSDWSPITNLTTLSDSVPPSVPGNSTWVVQDDAFHGEWDAVTTNTNGDIIPITRYEVELVAGAVTKIVSVAQTTGAKATYDLSFAANKALFTGSPQPTVTFRVRAVDNKELKSAWTTVISKTNAVPTDPTGVTATGSAGQIAVSWTAPATATDNDIVGYNVYIGATKVWSGQTTGFIYQTVTYTSQTFTVKALDKFGQESTGASASGTATSPFTVDTTAPGVPTGLAATITANANGIGATAAVSWTAVTGATDLAGYVVRYRRTSSSDNWTEVTVSDDTVATLVPLNFIYTGYDFQVRSFDFYSNFSAWSTAVGASGGSNTNPAVPTGLTAVPGRDSIVYSWTPVADTDLKNYEVTFSTSSTFASGNITYLTGTAATLTVSGLTPSTTYYARVRSTDTGALSSAFTSTNTTATTAFPLTPLSDGAAPASSPTPTVTPGIGYLNVSWTPVSNADLVTYEVHVSTTSGFTPSGATKAAENAGTIVALERDGAGALLAYATNYYVKLIAKDRDGSAAAGTQTGPTQIAKIGAADSTLTSSDVGADPAGTAATAITSYNSTTVQPALNGKNKVVRSTSAASGTSYVDGDVWYQYSGANVVGFWLFQSGAWVSQLMASTTLKSVTAGQIDTGTLSASVITLGTTGEIRSALYTSSGGASGFQLTDTGLTIKTGVINANTLVTGTGIVNNLVVNTGGAIRSGDYNGAGGVYDAAASLGWYIGRDGLKIAGGTVDVATLRGQGQSIGGSGGAGIINVAAGTSLVMNGGAIYSSTYGSSTYNSSATAGFFISNGNVHIPAGNVSANSITAGSFNAGAITIGASGSITSTGFSLSNSGLSVTSGSIDAAALNINVGANLMPIQYADFEWNTLYYADDYTTGVVPGQGTVADGATPPGSRSGLAFGIQFWTAGGAGTRTEKWFGKSATDYNIAVDPSTTYIFSGYYRKNAGTVQGMQVVFKGDNAVDYPVTLNTTTVTTTGAGAFQRIYGTFTTGATTTRGVLRQSFDASITGDCHFDALQIERKTGTVSTPSQWTPPGGTTISGYGIRTGSIISTAFAQVWDTSLNSGLGGYKADNTLPAWSINAVGAAQFGDANVRGSLIVGPTNTTGNAVGTVTATNQSFMASSTYSPTAAGWILRADGTAEFRSVAIGSFSGTAIAKNTLAADTITGGTINAVVAIGSTLETTQQQDTMKATWSSGGTTLAPASSYFFYAEDIGALVTGTNIAAGTTITAYNASTGVVTISAATTGAGTSADIIVYRGRRVRINGTDGVTLTNSLGVVQIQLPTKAGVDAKFTGTITTSNINVKDNFSMLGTKNSISQGGILNLADANYVPSSAPQFTFDWTSQHLTDTFGASYAPNADSFVNTPLGWVYDNAGASTQKYWYFFDFFGPNAQAYDINLKKAYQTSAITTTFGSKVVYGGAALDHANSMFYYLTYDKGTTNWSVYSISRANVAAGMTVLSSGPTTWNKNLDGLGATGFASIGARAGAIYIAKVNNAGNLKIEKYANIAAVGTGTTTAVGNFPYYGTGSSVISVNVGQFDYGTGSTYVVATVLLGSGFMHNWVFLDNGSSFTDTGFHFPIPFNKSPIGMTYVGSSNDDAAGYFATLTSDGYVYKHTQLGKNNTTTTVNANQRWRSDATGGSYSPAAFGPNTGPDSGSITYQRRSRMTVSSIIDIPSVALGPNAVSFYVGHDGGSKFLQYDPDNGTSQSLAGKSYIRLNAFQDSNAVTGIPAGTLPTGTAGKITSTNGMYIQGDGHAHFPGTGWQTVGVTAGAATFNTGWGNFANATYGFARYRRVGTRVDVEGLVTRSSGGTVPFVLPSGFRPATGQLRIYITNVSGAAGRMDVYPETGTGAGGIDFPGYAATGGFLSINVSFYTD